MIKGDCAKQKVICTLVTETGEEIVGGNWCANPQEVCPRLPGEGYEKCKTVCKQYGHAEQVAVDIAGDKAKGSTAILEGHTYFCMDCQHTLFNAGVVALRVSR